MSACGKDFNLFLLFAILFEYSKDIIHYIILMLIVFTQIYFTANVRETNEVTVFQTLISCTVTILKCEIELTLVYIYNFDLYQL